jgi:hypothetical protein
MMSHVHGVDLEPVVFFDPEDTDQAPISEDGYFYRFMWDIAGSARPVQTLQLSVRVAGSWPGGRVS